MSTILNPFIRGYQNLRVIRTLLITYEDDCPPVWRPLHASQTHLIDDQVALFPCLFGEDFAIVTEGQDVPEELEIQCQTEGIVRTVVYAIVADDVDDQPVHVGDTYSEAAAHEVVRRLTFETGVYSRAWEISTAHITEQSQRYLRDLADLATPTGFMFIAFRVPYSPAIGVKLIATPWTDKNLQAIDGITAEQLREEHLSKNMPEDLMRVLHLAASADVRILILDADAPELDGLPVYDM
ncbi:MAG: ABC transporter substrate-binding protein [Burkholderiaceae bacterium]